MDITSTRAISLIRDNDHRGQHVRKIENNKGSRGRNSPYHEVGILQSSEPRDSSKLINLVSQYTKLTKVNNNSCDGHGCNGEATTEIGVNAGKFGIINLNLCENCRPKFKKSTIKEKQLASPQFWKDQSLLKHLVGMEGKEY